MLRDSTPRFVSPSVVPSVTLYVFGFCGLRPHCYCPNDQVTSKTAPAHPHANGVMTRINSQINDKVTVERKHTSQQYFPCVTAMESFTEQYFAKCGNCEEIGVREENRNPANKKRFAKPDLSVKRYAWETTVPDYIINGLDGIHRREVGKKEVDLDNEKQTEGRK